MFLTHITPIILAFRNQSIDLQCKSISWFLYDSNIALIMVNYSKQLNEKKKKMVCVSLRAQSISNIYIHDSLLKPKSPLRGHSHIESSHSLRQNDPMLQTYPPSAPNVKMPNLPKIDVYNFKFKISVGNSMKLFFLSHKYINNCINIYSVKCSY